jgi:hypothetical protein
MNPNILKTLLNLYPPYWGTGIRVTHISPDFRQARVEMRLRFYNRNYVGVHFGGSLFAMTDPFYMLMLMGVLGSEYMVWDKSSTIEYIRPGKGTVKAVFYIDDQFLGEIFENTTDGKKFLPRRVIDITDEQGQIVSKVSKILYIRKKTDKEKTKSSTPFQGALWFRFMNLIANIKERFHVF